MKLHEQIKNKKGMGKIRQQLRTNGTAAEAALWTMLKKKSGT